MFQSSNQLHKMLFMALLVIFISGCAKDTEYIANSADYTTSGIDPHDIESIIAKHRASLLQSLFIRETKGKKVLVISQISNETNEYIDVEVLVRKLTREMAKTHQFIITNAITGSGARSDKMIDNVRELRDNEEFNQYTTLEKGYLLSPELSLSGKITQRTTIVGDKERVDYYFLLVLTDLKSGRVLWDNDEVISKVSNAQKRAIKSQMLDDDDEPSEEEMLVYFKEKINEDKQQCQKGDMESCAILGWRMKLMMVIANLDSSKEDDKEAKAIMVFLSNPRIKQELDNASQYAKNVLQTQCKANNGDACATIAESMLIDWDAFPNYISNYKFYQKDSNYVFKHYNKENFNAALDLLKKSCRLNSAKGCAELAEVYDYYEWKGRDEKIALQYRIKSCNLGRFVSCKMVGDSYMEGKIASKNAKQALQYYKKSCDLRIANKDKLSPHDTNRYYTWGCVKAANLYYNGDNGVPKNVNLASEYYGKICDIAPYKCSGLAENFFFGKESFKQDYNMSFKLAKKTCDLNDVRGCFRLAYQYSEGLGITKDFKKAGQLYAKACYGEHSIPGACNNLGVSYQNGYGVEQNLKIANDLYTKACEHSYDNACFNLGANYYNGLGARQDYKKAFEYFGKACDLGEQQGCDWYKEMKQRPYAYGLE